MTLKITQKAETKLKEYLQLNAGTLPKVAVSSGGCSGFKYHIGLDTKQDGDLISVLESGLEILIPETSMPYLNGVVLDYKEEFMNAGFSFSNPNAHSCGCGSSFRPKDLEECSEE